MSWDDSQTKFQRAVATSTADGTKLGGLGIVAEADPNTNASAYADYPIGTIATSSATGVVWLKRFPDGTQGVRIWIPVSTVFYLNSTIVIGAEGLTGNNPTATFTAPDNFRLMGLFTYGTNAADSYTVASSDGTWATVDLNVPAGQGITTSGLTLAPANAFVAAGTQVTITFTGTGPSPSIIVQLANAFIFA